MDKEEIKKISQEISSSGLRDNGKFKQFINNITIMKTKDIAETLIEYCLMYDVDCEYVIDKYTEFKENEINDSDFKRILTACMMLYS